MAARRYVLALLFTPDRHEVVLMHKTRPAWQAGRTNALGGKVDESESPVDAARREVHEEAGVVVTDWEEFLVWHDAEYELHAMRAFSEAARAVRTAEDQVVVRVSVDALPATVIDNLRWLVPLALDGHVAVPIVVRSADPSGSGLTDRTQPTNR
jgi:8-oxo-dGTP pyrophosphatase MutT (NUDIX family)